MRNYKYFQLTVLFAALLMLYQILFAGGLVFMKDVHVWWHPFFEIAFLKHALDGITTFTLGFDRKKLACGSIYCYFENPRKLLDIIGMDVHVPKIFYSLIIIFFTFHFAAFFVMKYRVKKSTVFDQLRI